MACILGTRRGFGAGELHSRTRFWNDRSRIVRCIECFLFVVGVVARGVGRSGRVRTCQSVTGTPKLERLRAFSDVEAKTFLDSDRCAFRPDSPATRSASLTEPTQPARSSFTHQNALFHATHTAMALCHTTERTPAPAPRTHFKPLACFHHSRDHRSHARSYY